MATRTWVDFQGPVFTLKAPSDWFITASPDIQAMFVEPNRNQRVRANVILTIRPVQPDVTVEGVLTSAQNTQRAEYPEFNLIAQEDVQAGDATGKYQLYTWINPDGNVPIMQAQAFFIARQLLISITATCDAETEAETSPVFNEIFSSFRIEAPTA